VPHTIQLKLDTERVPGAQDTSGGSARSVIESLLIRTQHGKSQHKKRKEETSYKLNTFDKVREELRQHKKMSWSFRGQGRLYTSCCNIQSPASESVQDVLANAGVREQSTI